MKEIALKENSLRIKISSDRNNVSTILDIARDFFNQNNVEKCSKLIIVLRELVINSIIHGNMNDPSKFITCSISMDNGKTTIELEDQGTGFNHESIEKSISAYPHNNYKRGFRLINALASQIKFNNKGNHVKVVVNE